MWLYNNGLKSYLSLNSLSEKRSYFSLSYTTFPSVPSFIALQNLPFLVFSEFHFRRLLSFSIRTFARISSFSILIPFFVRTFMQVLSICVVTIVVDFCSQVVVVDSRMQLLVVLIRVLLSLTHCSRPYLLSPFQERFLFSFFFSLWVVFIIFRIRYVLEYLISFYYLEILVFLNV